MRERQTSYNCDHTIADKGSDSMSAKRQTKRSTGGPIPSSHIEQAKVRFLTFTLDSANAVMVLTQPQQQPPSKAQAKRARPVKAKQQPGSSSLPPSRYKLRARETGVTRLPQPKPSSSSRPPRTTRQGKDKAGRTAAARPGKPPQLNLKASPVFHLASR